MKRYLLFTFAEGSFNDGWDAFEEDFDDAQEAADAGKRAVAGDSIGDPSAWEVVDTDVKQVILSGCSGDNMTHPMPGDNAIPAHSDFRLKNIIVW